MRGWSTGTMIDEAHTNSACGHRTAHAFVYKSYSHSCSSDDGASVDQQLASWLHVPVFRTVDTSGISILELRFDLA